MIWKIRLHHFVNIGQYIYDRIRQTIGVCLLILCSVIGAFVAVLIFLFCFDDTRDRWLGYFLDSFIAGKVFGLIDKFIESGFTE